MDQFPQEDFEKKQRDNMKIFLVMCAALALSGCVAYFNEKLGFEDDNLIEEAIEYEIHDYTGVEIDLSPDTPERHTYERKIPPLLRRR